MDKLIKSIASVSSLRMCYSKPHYLTYLAVETRLSEEAIHCVSDGFRIGSILDSRFDLPTQYLTSISVLDTPGARWTNC